MSRPLRFYEAAARTSVVALCLCSGSCDIAGMTDVPSSTLSFAELMKLGRSLVMDRVPEQSRQSLPVPVRIDGALRIAFMYSPSQALPNVTKLAPPHFVAWLEPSDGSLVDVREVTPQAFGRTDGARDLLGQFSLPPGMDAAQYLATRERLFSLYEQLVPAWVADPRAERKDLRPRAQEFLRTFSLLSEPPLAPYYDFLGREYFAWVRAVAGEQAEL